MTSNVLPTLTAYQEPEYTPEQLEYIEQRTFENLLTIFRLELMCIARGDKLEGLNTRQRLNLEKAGVIELKRSLGRGPVYKLTPKAHYLILKIDGEEILNRFRNPKENTT